MAKKELLIIADYSEESLVTLAELCQIYGMEMERLHDFISHDIIKPVDASKEPLVFDMMQLQRMRVALRLQHDLEVNIAGAALALELLEEIEKLRAHAELLEKHLLKEEKSE